MADTFTKAKRSDIMSRIGSKDTSIEKIIGKFLFHKGFRYRKNVKALSGTPDLVLSKYKTVIFINGCFWHGHKNCKYSLLPETNKSFWKKKINSNIQRDKKILSRLRREGWKVIVVWQCQLRNKDKKAKILYKVERKILN